jgi:hypothetical protein
VIQSLIMVSWLVSKARKVSEQHNAPDTTDMANPSQSQNSISI